MLERSLEETLMEDYLLGLDDLEKLLIRARDRCDVTDVRLEDEGRPVRLLDNRRENGVRQCIDRALHLIRITWVELEGEDDA